MSSSASRGSWTRTALLSLLLVIVFAVPCALAPSFVLSHQRPLGAVETWLPPMVLEGLVAALLVLALWQPPTGQSVARRVWTTVRRGPNAPALLLLLLATLSYIGSDERQVSVTEWLRLGAGVAIYFVMVGRLCERRALMRLVEGLLAVAGVVAVSAVALYGTRTTYHMEAWFGNTELVSGLLVLLTPLVLSIAFLDPGPARRAGAKVVAVVAVPALLLTETRSAWLGLVAGVATLVFAAVRSDPDRRKDAIGQRLPLSSGRWRLWVVPALLLSLAMACFLGLSRVTPMLARRARTLQATRDDVSFQWRLRMWERATRLVASRPLTGWGLGSFPTAVRGQEPDRVRTAPSLSDTAHNEYLQTAAELGLPGLALYLWLLGAFVVGGARWLPELQGRRCRALVAGSLAAVVAQAVDAGANPAWRFADVSLFFWFCLGLGMAARETEAARSANDRPLAGARKPRRSLFSRLPTRLVVAAWRMAVAGTACVMLGQTLAQARSAFTFRAYREPEPVVHQAPDTLDPDLSAPVIVAALPPRTESLRVHVWPIPPRPGERQGQADWRELFEEASTPKWRYALSEIDVLYFSEATLADPVDDPISGLPDGDWWQVLRFCRRHKLKVAVAGSFGAPLTEETGLSDAGFDGATRWARDPMGWGEPHWRRLGSLCDRSRVPRSIVTGFILDAPFANTFGGLSQPPSKAAMLRFARQLHSYITAARKYFPTVELIEQEPYLLNARWSDDQGRNAQLWQRWVDAYREATGKPQANIEIGFELATEEALADGTSPEAVAVRNVAQLQRVLEKKKAHVGIRFNPTRTRQAGAAPSGKPSSEAETWARLYLQERGGPPAFVAFVPTENGPSWALPEVLAQQEGYREGTLMQDVRNVVHQFRTRRSTRSLRRPPQRRTR